jgi:hypothetical protein
VTKHLARLAALALLCAAADSGTARQPGPDDTSLWSPDGPPVFGHFRSAPLRVEQQWLVLERDT